MIDATPHAQYAQDRHACDYQPKLGPIAAHAAKEWMNGLADLAACIRDNDVAYTLTVHTKRSMSDASGS